MPGRRHRWNLVDPGLLFHTMSGFSHSPRNRLLLALPQDNLARLMPDLEHINCQRNDVLMDADSSLEHVFFPDSEMKFPREATPTAFSSHHRRVRHLGGVGVVVPGSDPNRWVDQVRGDERGQHGAQVPHGGPGASGRSRASFFQGPLEECDRYSCWNENLSARSRARTA